MLEQDVINRASEQGQFSISYKMVLISYNTTQAIQLFELFSKANFDVCYTKTPDEALISAVKPQFIVYNYESSSHEGNPEQKNERFIAQLHLLQQYNLPIIVLLDEHSYLTLAPIDIPNVSPMLWKTYNEDLLGKIDRIVEEHSRFSKFEDGIIFKDLVIDTRRMIVRQNSKRIDLTKTEYDLLMFFIYSDGIVQARETLLEKVWKLQFFEGSNIVDVHIKSLRKKLNDSAVDPKYIVTVRGVGYRLADV